MNAQHARNPTRPLLDPEDERQRRIVYVLPRDMARARLEKSLSGKYSKTERRTNMLRKLEALGTGNGLALLKDQVEQNSVTLRCQLRFPFGELAAKGGRIEKELREVLSPEQRRKIANLGGHVTRIGVAGQGHNTPFAQLLFESDCARDTAEFVSRNPSLPVVRALAAQEQPTQETSPALGAWESGTYFGYCPRVDLRAELRRVMREQTGLDFDELFPGVAERAEKRRAEVVAALKKQGRFDFDTPDIWYSCGAELDELIETHGAGLTEETLHNCTVLGNMKEGRTFVLAHSLLGTYLLRDTARNFLVFPGKPEVAEAKDPENPDKTIHVGVLPESDSYFLFAPNDAIKEAIAALTRPESLHAQLMKATHRTLEFIRVSVQSGEAQSGVYVPQNDGQIAFMFDGRPLYTLPASYECVFNLSLEVTLSRNRTVTQPPHAYADRLVVPANPLMHNSWPQAVFPASSLLGADRPNVQAGTPSLVYTQAQLSHRKSESLSIMARVAKSRRAALEAGEEISSAMDDAVRTAHEHAEQTGEIYRGDLTALAAAASSPSSSSSSSAVLAEDD